MRRRQGGIEGKGEGGWGGSLRRHAHSFVFSLFFCLLQTGAGVASAVGPCRPSSAGSRQSHGVSLAPPAFSCSDAARADSSASGFRCAGKHWADEEVKGDV